MGSRFQKAVREKLNLRMAIDGPSGSGKSFTALRIAMMLAKEYKTKVALIESENRSARKYLGVAPDGIPFEFCDDVLKSYSPTEYTASITAAEAEKFGVLVIDSLSHAWTGKDGALELVDKQGKNKFTDGWKTVTPMHNRMIEAILAYRGHVIVTMRSKTEYIIEEDEKGRKVPRKVALAPIQRQGMEYEFDIYGSMDWSHVMTITKSRCPSVDGLVMVKPGASFIEPVITWLNTGEVEAPEEVVRVLRISDEQLLELTKGVASKGMSPEAVKKELMKRYQVERLADLTPSQAEDFLRKRLGKRAVVPAVRNTSASPAPAQDVEPEDVESVESVEVEHEVGGENTEIVEETSEPPTPETHGEQIEKAVSSATAKNSGSYPSPDAPVSKGQLGSLNNAIAKFIRAGNSQDVVTKAIKKRNPSASSPADLTNAQAEDLEASILKRLNGPHEPANPQ